MFRILVVRLGSMGDVIHALPAVASLKHSFPHSPPELGHQTPLGAAARGQPFVDEIIPFDRSAARFWPPVGSSARPLQLAVDLQGLIQSALVAASAKADKIVGLARSQARESFAAMFYSTAVRTTAVHRVDRYLELVAAAGASNLLRTFPLPPGEPEGTLPEGPFVLACPLAGWGSKQWPLDHFAELAGRLSIPLVVNGPPDSEDCSEKSMARWSICPASRV